MKKENNHSIYGVSWNRFYSHLTQSNTPPLWNVEPEQSIKIDYSIFKSHFDHNLPIIDLGCGTGTQSCFLSQFFPQVIGLDASDLVIEKNKKDISIQNISFEVWDGLDLTKTQQLNEKLGDSNVYIRAVLHQLREVDRSKIVRSIEVLMGEKGTLFMVEVLPEIANYLISQGRKFSDLPLQMKSVFLSDLAPVGLDFNKISNLFPEEKFEIVLKEKSEIATTLQFSSGELIKIPAAFYVIRNRIL